MDRTVFFNVGWMNRYAGVSPGDSIRGGGAWVERHGVGHEVHNFAPYRGRYYGSVQPPGGRKVNIDRLGASPDSDYVDGVTVAWVAKRPSGGLELVGWYVAARIYREWQTAPRAAARPVRSGRDQAGYFAVALCADGQILDPDERTLKIPRNRRGGMGQSKCLVRRIRARPCHCEERGQLH